MIIRETPSLYFSAKAEATKAAALYGAPAIRHSGAALASGSFNFHSAIARPATGRIHFSSTCIGREDRRIRQRHAKDDHGTIPL